MNSSSQIFYDNIESESDTYRNNQYVGTWSNYDNLSIKPCNWGECRIPFSADLDLGAGAFSPNPKYFTLGWNEFD